MPLPRITFRDIQTREILFYDPDLTEACFQYCQDRNLDCMPSLNDPSKFNRKTETGFCEESVPPERMIDGHEFIFAKQLLDRFRAHNLLFVYQETELTGVVHFSDYNRPSVNAYLFNLLSAYERSLRKVLSLSGLNNRDMLNYFTKMIVSSDNKLIKHVYSEKLRGFEKNKARYEKLHDFDRFPLKDLIDLAKHHHIICLSEKVIDLRNMVMHAQELVNIEDAGREDFIYDFSSFEKFFIQVDILLHDYKKANNLISFKELERA